MMTTTTTMMTMTMMMMMMTINDFHNGALNFDVTLYVRYTCYVQNHLS